MKKIILIGLLLIAATFALVSCSSNTAKETDTKAETTIQPKDEHSDKEISDDWRNITVGGEHDVRVMFVNVGKADSIIVEVDGLYYMIDTGTRESVPYTVAALEAFGVERIENVFITHPDQDHVGGYTAIRELYEVGKVYSSSICGDMYVIEGAAVRDEHIKLDPGQVVELSDGVYFEVLSPIKYNSDDDNNNSLVLRLQVNGVTTIFAGDMKKEEETELINTNFGLKCDILKIGHHGRKDATSAEFVAKAQPDYAVISTSTDEEDRSAHEKVITRLENIGCEVLITENYDLGIMLTIGRDGKIEFENVTTAKDSADIRLDKVSKEKQTAVLVNKSGENVDLSGWYLTSSRGGEIFRFPDGTIIKSGAELTVSCKGGDGDVVWNEAYVWHDSKDDKASLIDCFGNFVDEKDSK